MTRPKWQFFSTGNRMTVKLVVKSQLSEVSVVAVAWSREYLAFYKMVPKMKTSFIRGFQTLHPHFHISMIANVF
ncbi:hypothetical protein D915_011171 [Fasciola hepatica]|uniref:Uncharacterized protein n=1 Tax=Fasciola hepatica TaxID=6192 RepID=A0A4E0R9X0_FASHE|nr:hypothetical protein D915_011171 [Fasciola hepatica]